MTTDSAVASLQADLTALRAENKELTEQPRRHSSRFAPSQRAKRWRSSAEAVRISLKPSTLLSRAETHSDNWTAQLLLLF